MSNARINADSLRNRLGAWVSTLTPGAAVTLDFSYGQTIGICDALATACVFSTANIAAGRVYGLRLRDNGTTRNLTFPAGWTWLTTAPTATTANKWMIITMEARTGADAGIVVDWKVQP